MAEGNIGDALRKLFDEQRWSTRIYSNRLVKEWEQIVGVTISKYTKSLSLSNKVLFISTDVPVLKHELQIMKAQLIEKINDYFQNQVVTEVVIK